MNRVVAGDGVVGDENLQAAFQAFHRDGADTGVQMNSGEDDRVAIYFFSAASSSPPANPLKPLLWMTVSFSSG